MLNIYTKDRQKYLTIRTALYYTIVQHIASLIMRIENMACDEINYLKSIPQRHPL